MYKLADMIEKNDDSLSFAYGTNFFPPFWKTGYKREPIKSLALIPKLASPPWLKFSFFFDLIPYPFVGHFVIE